MACVSTVGTTWVRSSGISTKLRAQSTRASLCLVAGSRIRGPLSLKPAAASYASGLLQSSFLSSSSSSSSLSFSSSSFFSDASLGVDFSSSSGLQTKKRRGLVVVRAGKKYQLCQTKRNRSRKSLARTHGFRLRMRSPTGRAVIKRRRAKGRKVLCTKSNPSSGKRA